MIADLYLSGVPRRVGGDDKKERKVGAIRRAQIRMWHDKRGASQVAPSAFIPSSRWRRSERLYVCLQH
jgi:hypothetical protein